MTVGIGVLVLFPWPGLSTITPFAQVVSFRPVVVVAALLGALSAWVVTRFRSTTALLVLAASLLSVITVAPRVLADTSSTPWSGPSVLSINVDAGQADVNDLAMLIIARRPGIVVLPESGDRYRGLLMTRLAGYGYRAWTAGPPGLPDVATETILAAAYLGPGSPEDRKASLYPWVTMRFPQHDLTVVAVHTAAPSPSQMDLWADDLARIAGACATSGGVVVAGDFNATVDHPGLRSALKGCTVAGPELTSTWPSWAPRWAGTRIDHVAVTPGTPGAAQVLDVLGSDHRGVFIPNEDQHLVSK